MIPTMVLPLYTLLIHNLMSFITKFSIVLIALWIVFALMWSSLFWIIIVLFPILLFSQLASKNDMWILIVWIFIFIIFAIPLIDEGILSIWDIIVFLYIFLWFFVIWKLIWIKSTSNNDISPYIVLICILSLVWTIWISAWMPNPKTIWTTVPTSTGTVIPVWNTSSIIVTDSGINLNSTTVK